MTKAPVVNTGDEFWQIMDHLLCISATYPTEARKDAKELCKLWEEKKKEIASLEHELDSVYRRMDLGHISDYL